MSQAVIFDPVTGRTIRSGAGVSPSYGGPQRSAREQELEATLKNLKDEPRMAVTVVEVREKRMLISLGSGSPVDIHYFEGAKVGDRVLINRNTLQVTEIIPDDTPTGTIVTVERATDRVVEGTVMGMLRAFKAPPYPVKKGERVVVDPSLTFVTGTLGVPPQAFSRAKISVAWDDIGGQDEAKDALREAIELPVAHPHLFKMYGKRPVKGVLLEGPPGTGKSILAKAAATAIARAHGEDHAGGFIYVKGPELLNMYIGRSEQAVRELFGAARAHKDEHGYPALVFLDECDSLLAARDSSRPNGINATSVVQQFLAEMDGLEDSAAMFILATNRPDILDPAVVRDGRIDRRVRVGRPTPQDARGIFEIHMRKRPINGTGHITTAVEALYADDRIVRELPPGMPFDAIRLRDFVSGAMIAEVVERATTAAVLRDVEAGRKRAGGITAGDLVWALDRAMDGLRHIDHASVVREMHEAAARRTSEPG